MKRLLNTLYVLSEDRYLTLDGENVVAKVDGEETGRFPLHSIESIIDFSYVGASPALMGACAERGIGLSFFSPRGKFLASVCGEPHGNVLLRKEQFLWSEDDKKSLSLARNFIGSKLYNSRWILERAVRDHGLRIDGKSLKAVSSRLADGAKEAFRCSDQMSLRGIEGSAAADYFSVFGQMVLRDKEFFIFNGRRRRPPTDAINAMLSLFYTVLAHDCASALMGVGLDPFVGFLHAERPGRRSLALDLMEELRAVVVDRFVLSAINNRITTPKHFFMRETGEVRLTDEGRKALFASWQDRKREKITHPFLKEKISWGLVPHVQALLLARCIRGDLDGYPPFLWK